MRPMQLVDRYAFCLTCGKKHFCAVGTDEDRDFFARHQGHQLQLYPVKKLFGELSSSRDAFLRRATGGDVFRPIRREGEKTIFEIVKEGFGGFTDNASITETFGTATAFTKTNANLANSATAGWMSNAIDNSSGLYLDALVHSEYAAVNTAPANSRAVFQYAYALANSGAAAYTSSGDTVPSGSEGTLTFPDVTTNAIPMPLLGVIPYPVQNKAMNGGPFSVARCFGGILPPKWGIAKINHTGMTLSTTNIYYVEVKYSVA